MDYCENFKDDQYPQTSKNVFILRVCVCVCVCIVFIYIYIYIKRIYRKYIICKVTIYYSIFIVYLL